MFQDQTLKVTGLHLEEDCFSHGQLYVFTTRLVSKDSLYIFAHNGKTRNIVYSFERGINKLKFENDIFVMIFSTSENDSKTETYI